MSKLRICTISRSKSRLWICLCSMKRGRLMMIMRVILKREWNIRMESEPRRRGGQGRRPGGVTFSEVWVLVENVDEVEIFWNVCV